MAFCRKSLDSPTLDGEWLVLGCSITGYTVDEFTKLVVVLEISSLLLNREFSYIRFFVFMCGVCFKQCFCEVRNCRGSDYEGCCLAGCDAV